jgi:hypothetical protein
VIARDALLALLGRLEDLRFSGSIELHLDRGAIAAAELRQTAPFALGGVVVLEAPAPIPTCAACGAEMVRDGETFLCGNCGERSGES